eukprot:gnl/Carplike_NY0171/3655_a4933_339.p2 GENE.gnl/Carplike_NY0171/3655_a4933_339~~gnl/Carplike_NY0171/3655_a4933_339.p2  ORF type:complete len:102 (-),score=2.26 gnl/Carplike_NY0171/3655_a4933_339:70-375(-)
MILCEVTIPCRNDLNFTRNNWGNQFKGESLPKVMLRITLFHPEPMNNSLFPTTQFFTTERNLEVFDPMWPTVLAYKERLNISCSNKWKEQFRFEVKMSFPL